MPEPRDRNTRRTIAPKLGQLLAGLTFAFTAIAAADTVSSGARTPVLIVLAATSAVAGTCGAVAHYREKRCRRG